MGHRQDNFSAVNVLISVLLVRGNGICRLRGFSVMHYYSVYLTLIRLEYLHKFCFLNLIFLFHNDTLKKGM